MFISYSMLESSMFGGLLCIQLLVILLLVIPPVQRIKDSIQQAHGLLQPIPIPSHCFESWSLDLITALPLSHGCSTVLTYVNCLTKLCRLTPCFLGGS